MTGPQAIAARALLRWTQVNLAEKAKIGVRTVARIENGDAVTPLALAAVARAFEDNGIRFFSSQAELAGLHVRAGIAIIAKA